MIHPVPHYCPISSTNFRLHHRKRRALRTTPSSRRCPPPRTAIWPRRFSSIRSPAKAVFSARHVASSACGHRLRAQCPVCSPKCSPGSSFKKLGEIKLSHRHPSTVTGVFYTRPWSRFEPQPAEAAISAAWFLRARPGGTPQMLLRAS